MLSSKNTPHQENTKPTKHRKITFLGTGGGRVNLIKQHLQTGGFRIDFPSLSMHVDPGPGALIHSVRNRLNVLSLDAVLSTHIHIDHCNDCSVLVEGMTGFGFKKRGLFIGSESVINGDGNGDHGITRYHLSKVSEVSIAKPGERKLFKTSRGSFEMEFLPVKHDDSTGFGFKLHSDGLTLGYTSDTEYFDELPTLFSGCDVLIINCLKPDYDGIPDHMTLSEALSLLRQTSPKKAFLTHLGMNMISYGLNRVQSALNSLNPEYRVPKDNEYFLL